MTPAEQIQHLEANLTEHDRQAMLLLDAVNYADSTFKKLFATPRFAALSAAAGAQLMLLQAEQVRMQEEREDLVTAIKHWAGQP